MPYFVSVSDKVSSLKELFIVSPNDFHPEAAERWQYIVGTALFPCLLFGLTLAFRRVYEYLSPRIDLGLVRAWLTVGAVIVLLALAWFDNAANQSTYIKLNIYYKLPVLIIPLLGIAIGFSVYAGRIADRGGGARQAARIISDVIAVGIAAVVSFMNVFSASALTDTWPYTLHLNALLYPVSQIQMGKTILVNAVSQYGLFPHLLAPLFALTGLSVLKFTFVMSLLLFISFLCLYVFIRKAVANSWLALLGFTSLVYFGYVLAKLLAGDLDPYFQYHPVRFLFPALLILLSYLYFTNKSKPLYLTITFLAAISVLWNVDTGLMVFLTWLAVLVFQEFLENPLRVAARKAIVHAGTVLGVLFLCLALTLFYLFIRSGTFPNLSSALSYQSYFVAYGFYMMPMPLIAPWNLVILTYAAGLAYSVKALLRRENSPRAKAVFLLSVLGVGLFSYYQGRSHDYNLLTACYPAFLLITLAAEGSLKMSLQKKGNRLLGLSTFAAIMIIFSSAFFSLPPSMAYFYGRVTKRIADNKPTQITDGLAFIDSQTRPGEEVLILSYHAGAFYAESRTVSPMDGPGFSELLLRRDYNAVIDEIRQRRIDKIFLDSAFLPLDAERNRKIVDAVYEGYKVKRKSPSDRVILFEKRTR